MALINYMEGLAKLEKAELEKLLTSSSVEAWQRDAIQEFLDVRSKGGAVPSGGQDEVVMDDEAPAATTEAAQDGGSSQSQLPLSDYLAGYEERLVRDAVVKTGSPGNKEATEAEKLIGELLGWLDEADKAIMGDAKQNGVGALVYGEGGPSWAPQAGDHMIQLKSVDFVELQEILGFITEMMPMSFNATVPKWQLARETASELTMPHTPDEYVILINELRNRLLEIQEMYATSDSYMTGGSGTNSGRAQLPANTRDKDSYTGFGLVLLPTIISGDYCFIKIQEVIPGSPAEKAGLMEDAWILEINGAKVAGSNFDTKGVIDRCFPSSPGQSIVLKVAQGGGEKTVRMEVATIRKQPAPSAWLK